MIVLSHLTPTQRRALMIADNSIAANSFWNDEMLAAELAALKEEAFDLDLLGFNDAEIDRLLAGINDDAEDLDKAPEPPADPIGRLGDLWICGEHRVLCGEYNYMDFGSDRVIFNDVIHGDPSFTIPGIDQQIHTVMFGVNWRWGSGRY